LSVFAFAALFAIRGPAAADTPSMDGAMAMDHHHHHHDMQAMDKEQAVRSIARYEVPDVTLRDAEGKPVSLRTVLADKEPLMLNFIYTSCTSVCPAMSGTFSQVQSKLGKTVHLISISIDPEYDTPDRLKAYAKRFGAGSQWTLLTGSLQDSVAVQRAFAAYRGDKMDHVAATFLRADPDQPWVRLDGLASADDLIQEYHRLVTR
jgi:protein SCO1/2